MSHPEYRLKRPNPPMLLYERSDDRMFAACHAGFTVVDCLALGLSPIALTCNEGWKPLLELACERFGYCWKWVAMETWPSDLGPQPDYHALSGEVVLTKVER